jgi:single-stranded-DNA-specific exonuclease
MHRRWLVNKTNPDYIKYLSEAASISPVLAQILINRGIKTFGEVDSFLNPRISLLSDPFDIDGIKTACDRILSAAKKGEKVLVHGDYDVDGLSATAIILSTLKTLGICCSSFIPHRMKHGYGFNLSSLKEAKQTGASLIITVDCGITSFEATAQCRKEGIDIIITDHHEPALREVAPPRGGRVREGVAGDDFLLPDAFAVINPKISGLQSPSANLSGSGVAFKLAHALAMSAGCDSEAVIYDLLDLAALGTMADFVPLTGENRLIVKEGLKLIEKGTRPGLQALKTVSNIDGKTIKSGLLLFTVIPRINAAGRISDSNKVPNLLLTDSESEAIEIASWLDKLNKERQRIEEEVYQQALSMLKNKGLSPVVVLSSEGWHSGVIGIVASRITEEFFRPAILLSVEGNIARGSARSIPSFDMFRALAGSKKFLNKFGGHKQAAGLELEPRDISSFEGCVNRIANEMLTESDFVPSLGIDADVDLSDISFNLTREFEMLEPFGSGNPAPLLGSKRLEVLFPKIVKENHLKMKLRQKNQSLDAIGFNMASFLEKLSVSTTVDAVYTPLVNEWDGVRNLQLNLKALRPSL